MGIRCPITSETDGYRFTFDRKEFLPNEDVQWIYVLENFTGEDLSLWILVPCAPIQIVSVLANGETVTFQETNNPGGSIDCLPDETTGYEIGPDPNNSAIVAYIITTAQDYPTGTVQWGAVAGGITGCGVICGPCPL